MKIRPEVEVFTDPEYCYTSNDDGDFSCNYLKISGGFFIDKCILFNENISSFRKCDQCKADCLAAENGIIEIAYPQIMFAVRWMIENIDTDQVDCDDPHEIKKLADTCHVAYLKET